MPVHIAKGACENIGAEERFRAGEDRGQLVESASHDRSLKWRFVALARLASEYYASFSEA